MFWAEERETPDILKGPSCPRTGVMVELSTSFSTALNGCSKALTVCTVLRKERSHSISKMFFAEQNSTKTTQIIWITFTIDCCSFYKNSAYFFNVSETRPLFKSSTLMITTSPFLPDPWVHTNSHSGDQVAVLLLGRLTDGLQTQSESCEQHRCYCEEPSCHESSAPLSGMTFSISQPRDPHCLADL